MPADLVLLEAIRRARRELAESGPPELRSDCPDGDFERVSIPLSEGDVLRDLLIDEHARVVIEIGLAYGSSALAIAEGIVAEGTDASVHVIIDAFQEHFQDTGWHAITSAGLSTVCSLQRERSQLALPRLVTDGFVADVAFVDGSHIFHNVFVDLFFLRELVRPGGLIVLDDCEWPSVATAVRYFEINCSWQPHPIRSDTRLRAYRLPNPRVEPGFEDFQPFSLESASGEPGA